MARQRQLTVLPTSATVQVNGAAIKLLNQALGEIVHPPQAEPAACGVVAVGAGFHYDSVTREY